MALINLDLVDNNTTTIDSSNANNNDTLSLGLGTNATLIIDGVNLTLTNLIGGGVATQTTIQLQNGANLVSDAQLAGVSAGSTFHYIIGDGSTMTLDAAFLSLDVLQNTSIDFANANGHGHFVYNPGTLNISLLGNSPDIFNVQAGDQVTVAGATGVSQVGNTITFHNALGPVLGALASYDIPAGATYTFDNGSDTATFVIPCFVRGTQIAIPGGEVAVEHLQVGDLILGLDNGPVAVKWVGNRTIDPKTLDKPRNDLPIRISAGAIAENMPTFDLYVSPDHCMFIGGSLVPAKLLINGTTVTQPITLSPIEYFHVELEEHDVLWANGALAETYLDLGNRASFAEPGVLIFTVPGAYEAKACYPLAYTGPAVDAARDIVAEREVALGYTTDEAVAS
jgi:hypothetical protein